MSLSHALANRDICASHAETERVIAVRDRFRAAAAELTDARDAVFAFVEEHAPIAQEVDDEADRLYRLGLEWAGVLDDLARLATRISRRPVL